VKFGPLGAKIEPVRRRDVLLHDRNHFWLIACGQKIKLGCPFTFGKDVHVTCCHSTKKTMTCAGKGMPLQFCRSVQVPRVGSVRGCPQDLRNERMPLFIDFGRGNKVFCEATCKVGFGCRVDETKGLLHLFIVDNAFNSLNLFRISYSLSVVERQSSTPLIGIVG
jgi:hypothetical protein